VTTCLVHALPLCTFVHAWVNPIVSDTHCRPTRQLLQCWGCAFCNFYDDAVSGSCEPRCTVTTVPPNTGAAAGTTVEVGEIPVSTNVTTGATAGPVVTTAEVGEPPLVTADGTTAGPVVTTNEATTVVPTTAGCDATVTTSGISFVPDALTITVGQTVCFQPTEFHNVEQTTAQGGCTLMSPQLFGSSVLGVAVTHTFTEAGSFFYRCRPHCGLGMVGNITVVPPPATTPEVSTTNGAIETTPLVCPVNCGQPENGGGTCDTRSDGSVRCLSCNADKFLYRGRCNVAINCQGNRILSGRLSGGSCSCADRNNCYYCRREAGGDTCFRCRNRQYLYQDSCHEGCPAHLAASGSGGYGRKCIDPFVCRSTTIGQLVDGAFVPSGLGFGCRCPDRNCFQCNFHANTTGTECTFCRSRTFLFNGRCHADCDVAGAPSTHIEYNPGNYGRECREPFVCVNNVDATGRACKCHKSVNIDGRRCRHCQYNATGVFCLEAL